MPENAADPVDEPAMVPATHHGHCILVVDDEPTVADALAGFIRLCGHEVCTAHSLDQAVATIDRRSVDAVFCDLRMPDGGAPILYERLATPRPDLHGRFVFVTGDLIAGPNAISRATDGGAVRVLEKPFSLNDVQARLAEVLVHPPAEPVRS
jgi:DNA-binding NtrC family response regulator